jgi:hypothetical protein
MKALVLLLLYLASASTALSQVAPCDSQAMREIATELRAMHSELRQQTARTQAMQVLLFEMQTQQALLDRAIQRFDEARGKVIDVQEGERHVAAGITASEDVLRKSSDEVENERITAEIERHKAELASLKITEQDRLTLQQQADLQLQRAQSTYDATQNELNQFMKSLENVQQQPNPK